MKFENIRVYNFEHALRGMRNPKDSWHLSDSYYGIECCPNGDMAGIIARCNGSADFQILHQDGDCYEFASIGPNDMRLAQTLIKAGGVHRKFMRQIFVTVDITAPLYWFKEFDTYKVGTVANSTSTMHTIQKKPITIDCFETGDYCGEIDLFVDEILHTSIEDLINKLERLRQLHLQYAEKAKNEAYTEAERAHFRSVAKLYWKELIRWLPESWLQTRTVTMTYENLFAMCSKDQRRFHKLTEWSDDFIKMARVLPYAQDLIFIDEPQLKEE